MANDEGIRATAEAIIVSMVPDVCLDATGTPVPYSIIAHLDTVIRDVSTVRMAGFNAVTMSTRVTSVTGDEEGIGGGIISGVNLGQCRPITYAPSVRIDGDFSIRHSALYWMNCAGIDGIGNTIGRVFYVPVVAMSSISDHGEIDSQTNPPIVPETQEEENWFKNLLVPTAKAAPEPSEELHGSARMIAQACDEVSLIGQGSYAQGLRQLQYFAAAQRCHDIGSPGTGDPIHDFGNDAQSIGIVHDATNAAQAIVHFAQAVEKKYKIIA